MRIGPSADAARPRGRGRGPAVGRTADARQLQDRSRGGLAGRSAGRTLEGMTSTAFRVHDAFQLPEPRTAIVAGAERRDVYPIRVVASLDDLAAALGTLLDGADVAVITDEAVEELYGTLLVRMLRDVGVDALVHALPPGEASKSLDSALALWDWLAEADIARRDVVLNFGGGVVCDVGGWVASAYMRGLPYVNVPTTLLAQVDGALGGKVAVNHPTAKNLLGAFHQPSGVVAHVGFLASTSRRHIRAGLAEAIKKAIIASPDYWAFIDGHAEAILRQDLDVLERLVHSAAAIKTALVERDPYERDLRRPLNFGHTIGHPLETVTGYGPLLHGEAVALGMVVETRIAVARGLASEALEVGLVDLLERCGLPVRAADLPAPVDGVALIGALEKVRQIRAGSLRFVLPAALGETVIADDVGEEEIRDSLERTGFHLAARMIQ
jgi:3-dehydroquinate synthase